MNYVGDVEKNALVGRKIQLISSFYVLHPQRSQNFDLWMLEAVSTCELSCCTRSLDTSRESGQITPESYFPVFDCWECRATCPDLQRKLRIPDSEWEGSSVTQVVRIDLSIRGAIWFWPIHVNRWASWRHFKNIGIGGDAMRQRCHVFSFGSDGNCEYS